MPLVSRKRTVAIGIRIRWWVEINKIDTRIWELFSVPQPREIVSEIKPVHSNQQRKILDFARNDKTRGTHLAAFSS